MRDVGRVQNEIENVVHLRLSLANVKPLVAIYLSEREKRQIEEMEEGCNKKLYRLSKEKEALMDQGFA